MRLRTTFGLAALIIGAASLTAMSPVSAGQDKLRDTPKEAIEGQYIVVLNDTNDVDGHSDRLVKKAAGKKLSVYKHSIKGFSLKTNAAGARKIADDPAVKYVEPDAVVTVSSTQTVPDVWGLDRLDQRSASGDGKYNYYTTGPAVYAYIIDTGVLKTHTQFQGRAEAVFTAFGRDMPGEDCYGHGTHVAGTVGGTTFGVAKQVKIRAVKVFNCSGGTSWDGVLEAIDYVTFHASKPAVVNMSIQGDQSDAVNDSVNASVASGISYVIAAGNFNEDACAYSPASAVDAITVGSTGQFNSNSYQFMKDARSSYSNYGPCLDIFAPGANIESSYIGSDSASARHSGTSMAAPHVAGVVALYLSTNPKATPAQIKSYLVDYLSTKNVVTDAGIGSPNKLLFAGGQVSLTFDASPEPVAKYRTVTLRGVVKLLGTPQPGMAVEFWFDPSGSAPKALKGTSVTSGSGYYQKSFTQSINGTWLVFVKNKNLVFGQYSSDYIECVNGC